MHGVIFNIDMHLYTIAFCYIMYDLNYKNADGFFFLSFQWWMGLTTMT